MANAISCRLTLRTAIKPNNICTKQLTLALFHPKYPFTLRTKPLISFMIVSLILRKTKHSTENSAVFLFISANYEFLSCTEHFHNRFHFEATGQYCKITG